MAESFLNLMSSISVEHSSDHSLIVFTWKEKGKITRQVRDHSQNSIFLCDHTSPSTLYFLLFLCFCAVLNLASEPNPDEMHPSCYKDALSVLGTILQRGPSFLVLTTKATCKWTVFQQVVLPFLHCTVPFVLASFAQLLRLNIVTVIYKRKANSGSIMYSLHAHERIE